MTLKELTNIIPIESTVIIQINSKFNEKFKDYENEIHGIIRNMFHNKIEQWLTDEELEERIIRKIKRQSTIPFKFQELQDFGTISISVISSK